MQLNSTTLNQSASYEQGTESALDLFLATHIVYLETGLYILYSLIFIFGVLGNTIVIYVLITSLCINRHMQNLNNENTIYNKSNYCNKANIAMQPLSSAQPMSPIHLHAFNSSFKTLTKRREGEVNTSVAFEKKRENLTVKKHLNKSQIENDGKYKVNLLLDAFFIWSA